MDTKTPLRFCMLIRARGTMNVEHMVIDLIERELNTNCVKRVSFGSDSSDRERSLALLAEGIEKAGDRPAAILYPQYSGDSCTEWTNTHHMLVVRRCIPNGSGDHTVGMMYRGKWWWSDGRDEHEPDTLNNWLTYHQQRLAEAA